VFLVLNRLKKPRQEIVLDLSKEPRDENGEPYKIKEVLPPRSYGIDLRTYIERGLILKGAPEASAVIELAQNVQTT
jgi:hypothetical protein